MMFPFHRIYRGQMVAHVLYKQFVYSALSMNLDSGVAIYHERRRDAERWAEFQTCLNPDRKMSNISVIYGRILKWVAPLESA